MRQHTQHLVDAAVHLLAQQHLVFAVQRVEAALLQRLVNLAYASIRQHTAAYGGITAAYGSIRQHTAAYGSIRRHTAAYGSIRQHT
jgi:hypothetical protein